MRLVSIKTEGFRGLPDGNYVVDSAPSEGSERDVSVVLGGARAGKTSLLEAIAAAKLAAQSKGALPLAYRWLRRGACSMTIETTWQLGEEERGVSPSLGEREVSRWVVDAGSSQVAQAAAFDMRAAEVELRVWPATRALESRPKRLIHEVGGNEAAALAHHDATDGAAFALAERVKRRAHPAVLEGVNRCLGRLVPGLVLEGATIVDEAAKLVFRRRQAGRRCAMDELSAGERQGVVLAIAIAESPARGGIILFDEPELRVAEGEREALADVLVSFARGNQWIVATGSERFARKAGRVVARLVRDAPASEQSGAGLDTTLDPGAGAPSSLPFAKGNAPAPVILLPELDDAAGRTVAAPEGSPEHTLPFDRDAAQRLMRLDRYVELAVALRRSPTEADAIMARFGLATADQRRRIHALWKIRFEANSDLKSRFEELVTKGLGGVVTK